MDLSELKYVVEVKMPPHPFYEPMAAFNVMQAAEAYKAECEAARSKSGLEYRITVVE